MELKLLPISLFLCLVGCLGRGTANPVLSIVPGTTVYNGQQLSLGFGGQNLVSTIPTGVVGGSQILTRSPSLQSSILQLVRQPSGQLVSLNNGGLTQLVVPGQQTVLNGGAGGVPLLTTNQAGTNVLGLTTTGLSYPYANNGGFTVVNLNGVPVLVSTAELGLNNGLQTVVSQQGGGTPVVDPVITNPILQPFITQPVVREVAEVQEVETPASLVQLDSMDAALLDMENKGQMHMEKYAWGRSGHQNNKAQSVPNDNVATVPEVLRSDVPRFYSPLPTGSIVSSQPVDIISQNRGAAGPSSSAPSKIRNPFVDANGKRKKHFEFYQYFRNLNMNNPTNDESMIPIAFIPTN